MVDLSRKEAFQAPDDLAFGSALGGASGDGDPHVVGRTVRLGAERSTGVFVVMLLILVCSNVALLMFARAATRESEILVRNALGASRGRIIMQFFTEAVVLGSVAAVVGLAVADFGLRSWLEGHCQVDEKRA